MPEVFPANFVLRSERGEVLGGLLAVIWGGWLRVATLWVSELAHRQRHGSRLLEAAEAYARERGCIGVCLDTFSFQARPFYERHGYTVFATQEDNPPGYARHFLEKRLIAAKPSAACPPSKVRHAGVGARWVPHGHLSRHYPCKRICVTKVDAAIERRG